MSKFLLNLCVSLAFIVFGIEIECTYLEELKEMIISEDIHRIQPSAQELKLIELEKGLLRVKGGLGKERNSESGSSSQNASSSQNLNRIQSVTISQYEISIQSANSSASSSQSATTGQNEIRIQSANGSASSRQSATISQNEISIQSGRSSLNASSSHSASSSRWPGGIPNDSGSQRASRNEIAEASKRENVDVAKESISELVIHFLLTSYIYTALQHIKPIHKMMMQSDYYYQTGPAYTLTVPTWRSVLWTHKYALLKQKMNYILPNTDSDYNFLENQENSLISQLECGPHFHWRYNRGPLVGPLYTELSTVCRIIVEYLLTSEQIDPSFYEFRSRDMTRSKIDGFELVTCVYECQHFSKTENNNRLAFLIAKFSQPPNHYALLDGMAEWQNLDFSRVYIPEVKAEGGYRSRLLQVIQLSSEDNFAEKKLIFENE